MARLLVRDRTLREFEIDESALPFWQHLVEVLNRIPEPGDDPAEQPEESGAPKPVRAAKRPAQDEKE
ncbi:hypothetical protein [Nonomuraea sediminis]|uniref:hypothetical protein n=1 Tax=Nonomuraea sediminis TaxID=2835864 RepID=UPI001BDC7D92|nr:hypothetical protein [Nonomuraea sediminis]